MLFTLVVLLVIGQRVVSCIMTPREVIESFWRERAEITAASSIRLAAWQTKYFGEPLLSHIRDFFGHQKVDACIEYLSQFADSSFVVTREPKAPSGFERKRYQLSAQGDSWKITRIESECFGCSGSGGSSNTACKLCEGSGWYDHTKNLA